MSFLTFNNFHLLDEGLFQRTVVANAKGVVSDKWTLGDPELFNRRAAVAIGANTITKFGKMDPTLRARQVDDWINGD